MTARRLPVESLPDAGGTVRLPDAAAHHARVLRLAEGDPVVLFDGAGRAAEGRVTQLDGALLEVEIAEPRTQPRTGPRVTLVQALPKSGKLDAIARMATELGALAIRPVHVARSVRRLDEARGRKVVERLRRIVREASRQSGRDHAPEIHPPSDLAEAFAAAPSEALRLLLVPGAADGVEAAVDGASDASEAWILVGPEGGLDQAERAAAADAGWREVSLGEGVLRVETAAPVAIALVLHRLGGLRPPPPG